MLAESEEKKRQFTETVELQIGERVSTIKRASPK
jgi:hypothetical protein